jgi:GH24 family phage-related lysozyme (muramidase)
MMDRNFDMDLAIEQGCNEAQKFIDQLRQNKQKDMSDVRLLDAFLRQIPIPPKPDRPKGAVPLLGLDLEVVQTALRTPAHFIPDPSNVAPSGTSPRAMKNGSARDSIEKVPKISDLQTVNKGNIRTSGFGSAQPLATQEIPPQAVKIIQEFEGCELSAYPDPKSGNEPWTIGWGTTVYPNGRKVRRGDRITQAQADEYFNTNLKNNFWIIIEKEVPHWGEMHDDMRAALCSFAYNLGARFYGNETDFHTITACLKEKRWHDVPNALLLYVNPADPNVTGGLKRRRRRECDFWQQGLSKLGVTSPSNQKNLNEVTVKDRGTVELTGEIKLKVEYYSQVDSETPQAERMCFSSTCAMALKYLRPEALSGANADDTYLGTVFKYGDTTDSTAQVKALKSYGITAYYKQSLSFKDLDEQLMKGLPVAVGWLHHGSVDRPTGGGHWCLVVGRKADGNAYYFMDPYGEADLVNGVHTPNKDGRYMVYSRKNWEPRWQVEGEGSGWGVIFDKPH